MRGRQGGERKTDHAEFCKNNGCLRRIRAIVEEDDERFLVDSLLVQLSLEYPYSKTQLAGYIDFLIPGDCNFCHKGAQHKC